MGRHRKSKQKPNDECSAPLGTAAVRRGVAACYTRCRQRLMVPVSYKLPPAVDVTSSTSRSRRSPFRSSKAPGRTAENWQQWQRNSKHNLCLAWVLSSRASVFWPLSKWRPHMPQAGASVQCWAFSCPNTQWFLPIQCSDWLLLTCWLGAHHSSLLRRGLPLIHVPLASMFH